MANLVVELYGTRIGALMGDWRTFDLEFEPAAVRTFGIDSPVLSVAVPLALVPTRAHKQKRRNFFQELLPEDRMLQRLAQEASVPESDTIGLLRRYGRDVAGALQIWDPEVPLLIGLVGVALWLRSRLFKAPTPAPEGMLAAVEEACAPTAALAERLEGAPR